MSYAFDTVQRALSTVRDAPNLTDKQRDLISFSQDVIDSMHSKNHDLKDAINHDSRVTESTHYLKVIIEEKDPEKQRKRLNEVARRWTSQTKSEREITKNGR